MVEPTRKFVHEADTLAHSDTVTFRIYIPGTPQWCGGVRKQTDEYEDSRSREVPKHGTARVIDG